MTATEILAELERLGDASTKKTLMNHGAREPFFGVKIAELKTILKKTKKNHALSLELYRTGNSDAMYLAGLMADETKISEAELDEWAEHAYWSYLCEFAVPWVASETSFGFAIGLKWIQSSNENVACAGWSTLASYCAVRPDEDLDIDAYRRLLAQVEKEIHTAPNRVKLCMDRFVIAVGSYFPALTEECKAVGERIGIVYVDMNGTACKVPSITEYIDKVVSKGQVGKKRKTARC